MPEAYRPLGQAARKSALTGSHGTNRASLGLIFSDFGSGLAFGHLKWRLKNKMYAPCGAARHRDPRRGSPDHPALAARPGEVQQGRDETHRAAPDPCRRDAQAMLDIEELSGDLYDPDAVRAIAKAVPLTEMPERALDSQALGLHHSRPFYRINNGQTRNQNQGRG